MSVSAQMAGKSLPGCVSNAHVSAIALPARGADRWLTGELKHPDRQTRQDPNTRQHEDISSSFLPLGLVVRLDRCLE